MASPHLIVVAGPPAAGKTTIARQIARARCLPLICKDTIKESLYEALPVPDRAASQRLGAATVRAMYALARDILQAGSSLVLESTFNHPLTAGELASLCEATGACLSVVYCHAAPEVLAARFCARARSTRHPGHADPTDVTAEDVIESGWMRRPAYPTDRTIDVDTTDWRAVSLEGILEQLAGRPCPRAERDTPPPAR